MVTIPPKAYIALGVIAVGGFLIWKFREEISGIVKGGLLTGSGLGMAYVGQQYFKDNKPVQYGLTYGGLGVAGLGAYVIAKPYIDKLRGYVPAKPTDRFGTIITSPVAGEDWCREKQKVEAKITNLTQDKKGVYVGMTIYEVANPSNYKDYVVRPLSIDPMGSAKVSWEVATSELNPKDTKWGVVVAVWNKEPIRGVTFDAVKFSEDKKEIDLISWKFYDPLGLRCIG